MKNLSEFSSAELREELQKRGYYTKILWHTDDVRMKDSSITEEQALMILDKVFSGEYITAEIFETIEVVKEVLLTN
jgi:hypothetical protein